MSEVVVACPCCGVGPGALCRNKDGRVQGALHRARVDVICGRRPKDSDVEQWVVDFEPDSLSLKELEVLLMLFRLLPVADQRDALQPGTTASTKGMNIISRHRAPRYDRERWTLVTTDEGGGFFRHAYTPKVIPIDPEATKPARLREVFRSLPLDEQRIIGGRIKRSLIKNGMLRPGDDLPRMEEAMKRLERP